MTDELEVLVTGRFWLGADGSRSIGSALVELIERARQEIIIIAYRLTTAVPEFSIAIENALARGCYVRLVLDHPAAFNDSEDAFLRRLSRAYPTLAVWEFREREGAGLGGLHAKVAVCDRTTAIVGSANFSRNGMVENHELAVRMSGDSARVVASVCDRMIANGQRDGVVQRRTS